ncbi:Eaa protein [Salmonella enterica]|uniref:Eaa protein n=1 Tax=Salmonella enterica TaxID=28901 RepID=UPI0039E91AF6
MTTITKEEVKAFIEQIESDLANGWEAQIFELKLARIALASLEAEPIGAFHIADQQVGGTSDYIKDGEWPIDNGVIEVYAAPPASEREQIRREHAEWSYADPVVFTDERNLRHIASGRETSLIWGKQNQEVGDIPLYRHAQPVPVGNEFIPKNLDKALGVVGVALPESKEEFNFQIERWIQLLIDRVIRYADEFKEQPAPVVPEEMNFSTACNFVQINGMAKEDRATLAMRAWNACRAAMLNGGKS